MGLGFPHVLEGSDLHSLRWSRKICLTALLFGSAMGANPLQGLENSLSSAVSSVNSTLQNATSSAGSAATSVTNQTTGALQNATQSVGNDVNTTVNATDSAAQTIAGSGASLTAGVINDTGITAAVGGPIASTVEGLIHNGVRHPFIFWPGFGTSRLRADVEDQDLEPDCPKSGTFHTSFGNPTILEGWPENCIYKLLEIQYDPSIEDFNQRFSSQPGVNTTMPDFGSPLCAPIPYEPMYLFFEAVGYTAGTDFFVACYDYRTSPYQDVNTDGAHLERAKDLVETAYANTGLPVYLVGHSNGPLYALALLQSNTAEWRNKYIAGFVSFAGNFGGQGSTLSLIFSGQSLFASAYYASAAPAFKSWPASYMQLGDPVIFNNSEVFLEAPVDGLKQNYTSEDFQGLFEDANLTLAQELAPELIGNISAAKGVPGTHFYGFYGSGLQTLVGVTLPSLALGSQPKSNGNFYSNGDSNQEETDNLAALRWNSTQNSCFHFELNEEKGVSHLGLPLNPTVLSKTVNILFKSPANCSQTLANASSAG